MADVKHNLRCLGGQSHGSLIVKRGVFRLIECLIKTGELLTICK
jgi:hypothetical protein